MEAREKAADTQLVSQVQAQATFTLYLQCIQRAQTGFINPVDYSVNVYPRIYALFLRVTPSMFNLKPHDCIYLAIDCCCDATLYISFFFFFFFPHSASFHFLHSSSSSSPFAPSFYLSFVFPFISLFLHQPTMDFFPLFQVSAHSFPTSYEFAFDDIVLAPLARSLDKNLGPFLGNNVSVIGDRSRCRGW